MSRKRTLYAREPIERLLAERVAPGTEGDRGVSPVMNRITDRYLEVVRRSEPLLLDEEWALLQTALSEMEMQPAALLPAFVPQAVADAVAFGGATKNLTVRVSVDALVEKLREMPYAQLVALADRIERRSVSKEVADE